MAHEHELGRALHRGGDVATEGRHVLPVDVLHRLVARRRELRLERLLDERSLRGELRLQREDPGDRLGILRVVETPLAPLRDVDHELHVGVLADGDGRDGDLVLDHAPQEPGEIAARHLTVGEEDDVLEEGRPLEELRVGLLERRVAIGTAARLDRSDGVVDRVLVLGHAHRDIPDELGVPALDADLVTIVEQIHHEVGGLLGEVELRDLLVARRHRHRARSIHRQHDGKARDLDLLLDLHRDRQRFFDRRAVVAAEAEALLAADHHEPAALVADVVTDERHLRS